jgi:hypothetical protein
MLDLKELRSKKNNLKVKTLLISEGFFYWQQSSESIYTVFYSFCTVTMKDFPRRPFKKFLVESAMISDYFKSFGWTVSHIMAHRKSEEHPYTKQGLLTGN